MSSRMDYPNLMPLRRTDFSYLEQPIRCVITCHDDRKVLSCDGRPVFLSDTETHFSNPNNEFALLHLVDGSILIQNCKTGRFLASNPQGFLFATVERAEGGLDKWIVSGSSEEGFIMKSTITHRQLACEGSIVMTKDNANSDNNSIACWEEEDPTTTTTTTTWSIHLLSGELGFVSLAKRDVRMKCDLAGNSISMSPHWNGWEAWRFSETSQEGHIRISPWAHSKKCLSIVDNDEGDVRLDESLWNDKSSLWSVKQYKDAALGLEGLVIQSVATGRFLAYNDVTETLCTIDSQTRNLMTELGAFVWEFDALHQKTYYITSVGGDKEDQLLEATKTGVIGTRNLPVRIASEEWKIEESKEEKGVVRLLSVNCQRYLGSNSSGEVLLMGQKAIDEDSTCNSDDWVVIDDEEFYNESDACPKWILEERDEGTVLISTTHQRVLVCPQDHGIATVLPGTMVTGGSTRWRLDPKTPRQVTKEKIQALGGAALLGVATSVATPLVFGGLVGAASVGWAGQVAMGSIRAIEAAATITRVTLRSSQILQRNSSRSVASTSTIWNSQKGAKSDDDDHWIRNRPFCDWRSW